MQTIVVFEKGVEKKYIKNYLDKNALKFNKIDGMENVYISKDDGEVICDIEITMPGKIRSTGNFKLNKSGFPITDDFEFHLYDFCLDKTPEDFDIEEAETSVTPLSNKNFNEIKMLDKLKSFLKKILRSEEIIMKQYDCIWFFGLKNTYYFDFRQNYAPSDEQLITFISEDNNVA